MHIYSIHKLFGFVDKHSRTNIIFVSMNIDDHQSSVDVFLIAGGLCPLDPSQSQATLMINSSSMSKEEDLAELFRVVQPSAHDASMESRYLCLKFGHQILPLYLSGGLSRKLESAGWGPGLEVQLPFRG